MLDPQVAFFALGVALLTGVLFGAMPALTASAVNLQDTLKEGTRGRITNVYSEFARVPMEYVDHAHPIPTSRLRTLRVYGLGITGGPRTGPLSPEVAFREGAA